MRRIGAHSVLKAATSYASLTLVVKAAAFAREAVIAAVFGVSGSMDAYFMALVVIGLPCGLLLNSAQTIYIRDFVVVSRNQGKDAASRFLSNTVAGVLGTMVGILALWLIFLPQIVEIVGFGFTADQRLLLKDCVYGLVVNYFLTGINLIGYGALQARKDFTPGALIPIVVPIVTVAMVFLIGSDLRGLIGGLTLGALVETVLVYRRLSYSGLTPFRWRLGIGDRESLRRLALGTAVLMPSTLFSGLAPVIEQGIASRLGEGAVSSLGYAAKFPALINGILVTAVGVTVLPHFSEMLANGEIERCRRFFLRYALLLATCGMVIAIVAIALSEPLVRIAFQRGVFTIQNTYTVTNLQQAYLLQIPGQLVGILSLRMLVATAALRAVTTVFVVVIPFGGLVQWWLSSLWGAVGVAYGTSLSVSLWALCLTTCVLLLFRSDLVKKT